MSSRARPRCRQDVHAERLPDGSAVLFDPSQGMAYPLTASAALVWDGCDGGCSVDELVDRVAERYDAPAEVIAADVALLLNDLGQKGLLEPVEGNGV